MKFREYKNLYSTDKIRRGIIRSKSLSDELDSATIILTHIDKINIESNDLVELTNESGELEYWFVASYNRKNVSFNPAKYDYTIDLMSLTKFLETIILPSLTITNIGQNRSILEYIENTMGLYFKSDYGLYTISTRLEQLCESTVCPECTFEEPTLREYLDQLLSFKNCLVKLNFKNRMFVLDYLDLNPNGSELDTKYITSMEQSQTAEQYVTQLEHTFTDIISQVPIIEYHKLKSEDYLFDTETAKLILNHKPYDMKSLIVKNYYFNIKAVLHRSDNGNTFESTIHVNSGNEEGFDAFGLNVYINDIDIDISQYLVVDKIFQTLETLEQDVYDPYTYNSMLDTNYVNNSLRWSRGSRVVDNFHYYQTKSVIWTSSDEPAISLAIKSAIRKKLGVLLSKASHIDSSGVVCTYSAYADNAMGISAGYDWKDVTYEVEYIPYVSTKLKLKQDTSFRHLISTPDNTTNTTTDLSSFIKRSLEKNKQLGNDSLMFYARSIVDKDGSKPVYSLGQYYLDEEGSKYILNYLETETKNNCILYKGILTKNFSNRNISTIINREKRYYSLADNSESVIRNEVKVKTFTLSLGNSRDSKTVMLARPMNIMEFGATGKEDGNVISGYISANTVAEKNIISHSALFEDNVVFATRVGSKKNGGYEMEYLKYTDSYGEISSLRTRFRCTTGKGIDVILNGETGNTEDGAFAGFLATDFEFLKDSREQICITVENIIVSSSTNSNLIVYEDRIASLVKSDTIYFNSGQGGFTMSSADSKLNFGKPLHELLGRDLTYPTNLEIMNSNREVCISVAQYNGEYLRLNLIKEE